MCFVWAAWERNLRTSKKRWLIFTAYTVIKKNIKALLTGQHLAPDWEELNGRDRRDFAGLCGGLLCTPKHMEDANGCHHRCASLLLHCAGLWGMRQLIGSVKAFFRGADRAPVEFNARASPRFKGRVLNPLLHALEVVLWCNHFAPSQPHNYYCWNKHASQRRFFPKNYSEGSQHFMMVLISNCQKTQQK